LSIGKVHGRGININGREREKEREKKREREIKNEKWTDRLEVHIIIII